MLFLILVGIIIYFLVRGYFVSKQDLENLPGRYIIDLIPEGNVPPCPPHQWEKGRELLISRLKTKSLSEEEEEKIILNFNRSEFKSSLICSKCGFVFGPEDKY